MPTMIFSAKLVLASILVGSVFATDADQMAFEKLLPLFDERFESMKYEYDLKLSQLEEQLEQLKQESKLQNLNETVFELTLANQVLEERVSELEKANDISEHKWRGLHVDSDMEDQITVDNYQRRALDTSGKSLCIYMIE